MPRHGGPRDVFVLAWNIRDYCGRFLDLSAGTSDTALWCQIDTRHPEFTVLHSHFVPRCNTMPTKNPRMGLSLPPEVHKALKDLSDATGTSASAFVVEILTSSLPAIKGITQAALMARTNPGKALVAFSELMLEAQSDVAQTQLEFVREGRQLRAAKGAGSRLRKKKEKTT